jgi:hypothetical protein
MQIKITHSFIYDTEDSDFREEFQEYQGDHPMTLDSLQEFIIDRFINPNFDNNGITVMEIV